MTILDQSLPLMRAGLCLHLLRPRSKVPAKENWSTRAPATEAELRADFRNHNIGWRPGQWSRSPDDRVFWHAIDLDIRDTAKAADAHAALSALWPNWREYPSVISGSGGESRHIYFATTLPFNMRKLAHSDTFKMVHDDRLKRDVKKNDWEIDLCGTGKNLVLPPSIHPDSGKPYVWERPLEPEDLFATTEVDSALVASWGAQESEDDDEDDDDLFALTRQAPLELSDDEVDAYIESLPEHWVEERDTWLQVGQALSHQYRGGQRGFSLWCDWSMRSAKFDLRNSRAVWRSFKGDGNPVTMRTVISEANKQRARDEFDFLDTVDAASAFDAAALPATVDTEDWDLFADPSPALQDIGAMPFDPGPAPDTEWVTHLARNEEGDLKATLTNVASIIRNDARVSNIIWFNEFRQAVMRRAPPRKLSNSAKREKRGKHMLNLVGEPWSVKNHVDGDQWLDFHEDALREILESANTLGGYGVKISDRDMRAAINIVSNEHRFHPIRDLLNSLVWDGTPRVNTLFIDWLGAEDNPYTREAARLMLLGAIARVMRPGCKFDFVPILEGDQGLRKSTFISTLAMHWAIDFQTKDLSDPTKSIEAMQGAWVIEMGEMSHLSRSDVNDLKAFVSRQVDRARLAYARNAQDYPRQCIFVGSTNDDQYLRDSTGGRRWWPIKCLRETKIDIDSFRLVVGQVWAEAMVLYREMAKEHPGELPLFLSEAATAISEREQEGRLVETAEMVLASEIEEWADEPVAADFDGKAEGAAAGRRDTICMPEIWREVMHGEGPVPGNEAFKIGKALGMLKGWRKRPRRERRKPYGQCFVYERRPRP